MQGRSTWTALSARSSGLRCIPPLQWQNQRRHQHRHPVSLCRLLFSDVLVCALREAHNSIIQFMIPRQGVASTAAPVIAAIAAITQLVGPTSAPNASSKLQQQWQQQRCICKFMRCLESARRRQRMLAAAEPSRAKKGKYIYTPSPGQLIPSQSSKRTNNHPVEPLILSDMHTGKGFQARELCWEKPLKSCCSPPVFRSHAIAHATTMLNDDAAVMAAAAVQEGSADQSWHSGNPVVAGVPATPPDSVMNKVLPSRLTTAAQYDQSGVISSSEAALLQLNRIAGTPSVKYMAAYLLKFSKTVTTVECAPGYLAVLRRLTKDAILLDSRSLWSACEAVRNLRRGREMSWPKLSIDQLELERIRDGEITSAKGTKREAKQRQNETPKLHIMQITQAVVSAEEAAVNALVRASANELLRKVDLRTACRLLCFFALDFQVLYLPFYTIFSLNFVHQHLRASAEELSNTAFAFASLSLNDARLFGAIGEAAQSILSTFNAHQLIQLLLAFALVDLPYPSLFHAAAPHIERFAPQLTEEEVGRLAFSLARVRLRLPLLFGVLHAKIPAALCSLKESKQMADLLISSRQLDIPLSPHVQAQVAERLSFADLDNQFFAATLLALLPLEALTPTMWEEAAADCMRRLVQLFLVSEQHSRSLVFGLHPLMSKYLAAQKGTTGKRPTTREAPDWSNVCSYEAALLTKCDVADDLSQSSTSSAVTAAAPSASSCLVGEHRTMASSSSSLSKSTSKLNALISPDLAAEPSNTRNFTHSTTTSTPAATAAAERLMAFSLPLAKPQKPPLSPAVLSAGARATTDSCFPPAALVDSFVCFAFFVGAPSSSSNAVAAAASLTAQQHCFSVVLTALAHALCLPRQIECTTEKPVLAELAPKAAPAEAAAVPTVQAAAFEHAAAVTKPVDATLGLTAETFKARPATEATETTLAHLQASFAPLTANAVVMESGECLVDFLQPADVVRLYTAFRTLRTAWDAEKFWILKRATESYSLAMPSTCSSSQRGRSQFACVAAKRPAGSTGRLFYPASHAHSLIKERLSLNRGASGKSRVFLKRSCMFRVQRGGQQRVSDVAWLAKTSLAEAALGESLQFYNLLKKNLQRLSQHCKGSEQQQCFGYAFDAENTSQKNKVNSAEKTGSTEGCEAAATDTALTRDAECAAQELTLWLKNVLLAVQNWLTRGSAACLQEKLAAKESLSLAVDVLASLGCKFTQQQLWEKLEERLARRFLALLESNAFTVPQLLSCMYSLICLYPIRKCAGSRHLPMNGTDLSYRLRPSRSSARKVSRWKTQMPKRQLSRPASALRSNVEKVCIRVCSADSATHRKHSSAAVPAAFRAACNGSFVPNLGVLLKGRAKGRNDAAAALTTSLSRAECEKTAKSAEANRKELSSTEDIHPLNLLNVACQQLAERAHEEKQKRRRIQTTISAATSEGYVDSEIFKELLQLKPYQRAIFCSFVAAHFPHHYEHLLDALPAEGPFSIDGETAAFAPPCRRSLGTSSGNVSDDYMVQATDSFSFNLPAVSVEVERILQDAGVEVMPHYRSGPFTLLAAELTRPIGYVYLSPQCYQRFRSCRTTEAEMRAFDLLMNSFQSSPSFRTSPEFFSSLRFSNYKSCLVSDNPVCSIASGRSGWSDSKHSPTFQPLNASSSNAAAVKTPIISSPRNRKNHLADVVLNDKSDCARFRRRRAPRFDPDSSRLANSCEPYPAASNQFAFQMFPDSLLPFLSISGAAFKYALRSEVAAALGWLQAEGWHLVYVPFCAWRQCSQNREKQSFILQQRKALIQEQDMKS